MNKSSLVAVLSIVAALGFGNQSAHAQMVESIKVTLPHAAAVGTVVLPAGDYTITETHNASGSPVLRIRAASGMAITALANPVRDALHDASAKAHVVLRRSGDAYQIQSVWPQGREYGYELLSADE